MNAKDLMKSLNEHFPIRDSWEGEVPFRGYDGAYYGDKGEGYHEFFHNLAGRDTDEPIDVPGLGKFTKIEYNTPFNQSGDIDAELVFEFEAAVEQETLFDDYGKKFYRITGSLDSWSGGPWDGQLREVKPVEKTITVWEKV